MVALSVSKTEKGKCLNPMESPLAARLGMAWWACEAWWVRREWLLMAATSDPKLGKAGGGLPAPLPDQLEPAHSNARATEAIQTSPEPMSTVMNKIYILGPERRTER